MEFVLPWQKFEINRIHFYPSQPNKRILNAQFIPVGYCDSVVKTPSLQLLTCWFFPPATLISSPNGNSTVVQTNRINPHIYNDGTCDLDFRLDSAEEGFASKLRSFAELFPTNAIHKAHEWWGAPVPPEYIRARFQSYIRIDSSGRESLRARASFADTPLWDADLQMWDSLANSEYYNPVLYRWKVVMRASGVTIHENQWGVRWRILFITVARVRMSLL